MTSFLTTRKISLTQTWQDEAASNALQELMALPSVEDVTLFPDNASIQIRYHMDALGFDEIVGVLQRHGLTLSGHRWMKLKAAWYRFTDENARANASSSGGSCCSQPKDIYAQRHRRG